MKTKAWISAFRLRTLPLALASIFMGGFLAAHYDAFRWDVFSLTVLVAVLLQILSNLANDYGDTKHGADHHHRKGPARAVQSGIISAHEMKRAIKLFVALCLLFGIFLLYISFEFTYLFFVFLGVGLLAIGAAIAYTNGTRPYGYSGLGDIFVLIFFGLVAVMGSLYLHTVQFHWLDVLPALSCGFFATAVLNVNNIRDIESDRKAGKYSIPVRLGKKRAVLYHWSLLILGFGTALFFAIRIFESWYQFIFLLTIPLLFKNAWAVKTHDEPHKLDPYLKQMALSSLLFVVLFGVGLLMG